jgi:hypothetical protein
MQKDSKWRFEGVSQSKRGKYLRRVGTAGTHSDHSAEKEEKKREEEN